MDRSISLRRFLSVGIRHEKRKFYFNGLELCVSIRCENLGVCIRRENFRRENFRYEN